MADPVGKRLVGFDSAAAPSGTDVIYSDQGTGEVKMTLDQAAGYAQKPFAATDVPTTQGASMVGFRGPEVGEVPKTVYLNLIETVRVSRWGADPSQTAAANLTALQKALNAKTKACLVYRDGDYHVNGALQTNPGAIIYHEGAGPGASRLVQDNFTSDLLTFNMNFAQGGGIDGLTLTSNVGSAGAQGSSGVALRVTNANDSFFARNFEILSYDQCIEVNGSFYPAFLNGRLLYFAKCGVHLTAFTGVSTSSTAGSRWHGLKISNFGYTGAAPENSIGMWLEQGSGEYFDLVDITQVGRGVVAQPPAGSYVRFMKFRSVLADTSLYEGWTFDGSAAPVVDIRMVDCYAAGSGGGIYRPLNSTRGAGLLTLGANLDDLNWVGGEIRDNDCGGWDHQGGSNCRLTGGASVTRNSRRVVQSWESSPPASYNNTYPGVHVHAGVSDWAIVGCDIGNFSLGVFNVQQAEGIVIDGGASQRFRIVGNNLSNPGTGKQPIANGSSSTNYVIDNNLPIQTLSTNVKTGQHASCATVGTVPAGSTVYIGCNGQQANEADTQVMMHRPGLTTQIIIRAIGGGPGGSETFTYTLYANGFTTGMTGQLTGSQTFLVLTANAQQLNAGDAISMKLVTSSNAAAVRHQIAIAVDG
ncbi:hypothetical protein KTD28_00595 [Burkholderia gladioli]|uniref:hypothetical protein n=1 Tax=Burkholderia gladioli TaxID=28095 RepID=UPI0016416FE6|nr:hypothetical protein [Burkholderia gladioli]MBU9153101.1 hypothetical protein [Burkholderia gladioli]